MKISDAARTPAAPKKKGPAPIADAPTEMLGRQ